MKCVPKQYLTAGPLQTIEEAPDHPGQVIVRYGLPGEEHTVRLHHEDTVDFVPGVIVVEGPVRVDWYTPEEFREHFTEV